MHFSAGFFSFQMGDGIISSVRPNLAAILSDSTNILFVKKLHPGGPTTEQ